MFDVLLSLREVAFCLFLLSTWNNGILLYKLIVVVSVTIKRVFKTRVRSFGVHKVPVGTTKGGIDVASPLIIFVLQPNGWILWMG